jgi:hypothetical protein
MKGPWGSPDDESTVRSFEEYRRYRQLNRRHREHDRHHYRTLKRQRLMRQFGWPALAAACACAIAWAVFTFNPWHRLSPVRPWPLRNRGPSVRSATALLRAQQAWLLCSGASRVMRPISTPMGTASRAKYRYSIGSGHGLFPDGGSRAQCAFGQKRRGRAIAPMMATTPTRIGDQVNGVPR